MTAAVYPDKGVAVQLVLDPAAVKEHCDFERVCWERLKTGAFVESAAGADICACHQVVTSAYSEKRS